MESIKKLKLSDIKKGSLVNEIRKRTVEFIHNGEQYTLDIKLRTLPFIETEDFFTRWDKGQGENVVSEWISKTLVDDKGELEFTKEEVDTNFVQPMANAIFEEVWGADNIKKLMELMKQKELPADILQANPKSSTN